ncbi:hypothetical protein RI054_14g68410 [Pseudoscourfieldia marina]
MAPKKQRHGKDAVQTQVEVLNIPPPPPKKQRHAPAPAPAAGLGSSTRRVQPMLPALMHLTTMRSLEFRFALLSRLVLSSQTCCLEHNRNFYVNLPDILLPCCFARAVMEASVLLSLNFDWIASIHDDVGGRLATRW